MGYGTGVYGTDPYGDAEFSVPSPIGGPQLEGYGLDPYGLSLYGSMLPAGPPVITSVLPATLTQYGSFTVVVEDNTDMVHEVLAVEYPDGTTETIWNGIEFTGLFAANSERYESPGLRVYTVTRAGGWELSPAFRVIAIDTDALVLNTRIPYTVVITGLDPVITNFSPPPGSVLAKTDAVSFDVTDNGLVRLLKITVSFPDGRREDVWDGTKFTPYYSASTRALVSGGHRYTVRRSLGGWPLAPTFLVSAADDDGNVA